MKQRQRGMTFLGIVIILLILGSALYAGIRLVPVYLEYSKVARSLEQVRDEHAAIETNQNLIRRSLERRWDVEDINRVGWKEIEIKKTAEGFDMNAYYEAEEPFVANVYLLVKFDKTVSIPQ
jgi:type II secretory pathway pseudopilin PulG